MANTSRPISTISYNSPDFLGEKLDGLRRSGIIEFAMWIYHLPDVDGTRPHAHVYIVPAQRLQTEDLRKYFYEFDPEHPANPLGVMPFQSSKVNDWILYGIHDFAYLAEKGLSRNVHYSYADIQSTEPDYCAQLCVEARESRMGSVSARILECVHRRMSFRQILESGMIPLNQTNQAFLFYRVLTGQVDDFFDRVDAPVDIEVKVCNEIGASEE